MSLCNSDQPDLRAIGPVNVGCDPVPGIGNMLKHDPVSRGHDLLCHLAAVRCLLLAGFPGEIGVGCLCDKPNGASKRAKATWRYVLGLGMEVYFRLKKWSSQSSS